MVDGFKATLVLANSSSTLFSAKSDEGCGAHALVGKPVFGFAPKPDSSTIALEVHDGSSGLTFTALPPSGADVAGLSSGIGLVPTGVASSTSIGSAPLTLQRSDGTTAWSIDTAVVTQAAVLAGHLIVVNPSGERIIVDPSSGKQSTNVNTAGCLCQAPSHQHSTFARTTRYDPTIDRLRRSRRIAYRTRGWLVLDLRLQRPMRVVTLHRDSGI
jgi:hypothetical protein